MNYLAYYLFVWPFVITARLLIWICIALFGFAMFIFLGGHIRRIVTGVGAAGIAGIFALGGFTHATPPTNDTHQTTPAGDYHPAPKLLPAFPDARPAQPKTPVQGGGGLRARWKDDKGKIYEWDYQHGEVERYDKTGKHHEGQFNPETGEQTKPASNTKKVKK